MRNIIKEMSDHMPESFLWLNVLLAAFLAIMTLDDRSAIQTVFFLSLWRMTHNKFFLKILSKKHNSVFFDVSIYNSGIFVNTI